MLPERDKPWLFRTYAGHSTAAKSNELYRRNLAKGQTGLSIAFDLPTQTGYDADHELARGEVGKVGVPVSHLGDMRALLAGIPLAQMNTSMTINATAAWLLALYVAVADEQGTDRAKLTGTIQNDIVKEYLSRGTYVFPPGPSLRLIKDTIIFTCQAAPKWNPTNVCSYHLQEAGATPVQELAFALATAQAVLDGVKASGEVPEAQFGAVVGRISFFVNAGLQVHHRDLQDARLRRAVGRDRGRPLRRERSQAPAVPLRRAGQLAGPHRAAGGKQRLSHPARDAGGDAVARRAGARRAAAGLERGARPAASLGPAMVAQDAADPGLRDRSARVRRHLRGLQGRAPQGRRAQGRGQGGAGAHRGHGRGGGRHRLHEARSGREQHRARAPHRGGRAGRGRRQPLDGDGRVTAVGRRGRGAGDRSRDRGRAGGTAEGLARVSRCQRGQEGARRARARRARRQQRDGAVDRLRQGRRDHRGMGRDAALRVRRIPGADRHLGRRGGIERRRPRGAAGRGRARVGAARADASSCWSASPASTAIPTAPSRSPCAPATAAWRWSTRASA